MHLTVSDPEFTNKEMVIPENSAHEGYIEEQEYFISSFRGFVDGL